MLMMSAIGISLEEISSDSSLVQSSKEGIYTVVRLL